MQEFKFKEKPACAYLNTPVPDMRMCHMCGDEIEIWSDEYEKVCRCGNIIKKEDIYADKA